jgi:hypothetical protein
MTKYDALEYIRPNEILQVMLLPEKQFQMNSIAEEFYRYKYDVPTSVYNAVLTFGIMKAQENQKLPNIVYLRKVMETFENLGITTTAAALKFLEDHKSIMNKKHRAIAEPEYMDDVMKRWANEEKELGIDSTSWVKSI